MTLSFDKLIKSREARAVINTSRYSREQFNLIPIIQPPLAELGIKLSTRMSAGVDDCYILIMIPIDCKIAKFSVHLFVYCFW